MNEHRKDFLNTMRYMYLAQEGDLVSQDLPLSITSSSLKVSREEAKRLITRYRWIEKEDVIRARCLTRGEYETFSIPPCDRPWLLDDGTYAETGLLKTPDTTIQNIRPVLELKSGYRQGEKGLFAGESWILISGSLALCDSTISVNRNDMDGLNQSLFELLINLNELTKKV